MKTRPKISVIMPVYNSEKFLRNSMESILNQTFKNLEFIILNDKSTDNSLEIMKKYVKNDKRIILINNNQHHLGITPSLNKGIRKARGKYIARMDSDDISLLNRLAIQYDFLEKNKDISLVGSNYFILKNKRERAVKIIDSLTLISKSSRLIEKRNPLIHSTIMFRNQGNYYREKFTYSQDYDFYLCLLTKSKKIAILPQLLVKYRKGNKLSISNLRKQEKKLFNEKAREFFYQRKKRGYDNYSKFNPEGIVCLEGY